MTTRVATPRISASSSGLVVVLAATASPIAQPHQARGCRARGSRSVTSGPTSADRRRTGSSGESEHQHHPPDPGVVARGVGRIGAAGRLDGRAVAGGGGGGGGGAV